MYFLFLIWAIALNSLECESFHHHFEYVVTPSPTNEEKEGRNPHFFIELNQDVKVVKEYEKDDREPEYFNRGEVNKLEVTERPCYVEDEWGTRREPFYPYRIVNGDDWIECASSGEKKKATEEPFRRVSSGKAEIGGKQVTEEPFRRVSSGIAETGEKQEVSEEPFSKNFTWMTGGKGKIATTEKPPEVLTIENRFGTKQKPVSEENGSGSGSGDYGIIDDEDLHHVRKETRIELEEKKNEVYPNRYGSDDFLFMD